jgi:hypothetical protein
LIANEPGSSRISGPAVCFVKSMIAFAMLSFFSLPVKRANPNSAIVLCAEYVYPK